MQVPTVNFEDFLEYFPELELPVTLTDESHFVFAKENQPLSSIATATFILPHEPDADEFTEFVPCFRIPETFDFHAVIYWMANLMNYQYVLASYSKEGALIDKKVIAGTYSNAQQLTTSVATIDIDWIIHIVTGQSKHESLLYKASGSKTTQMELLPEGNIIFSRD